MSQKFSFDEATHTYSLGGQKIPSVTEILDSCGLISEFAKSEQKRLYGSYIHKACHLLAQKRLEWSTVDPRIIGKVLAYDRFLTDNRIDGIEFETPHYHKDYLYGGTLDALVRHQTLGIFLYDIKTGDPVPYHALQTAAYSHFFEHKIKRGALFLYDDEKYSLRFHDDRADWGNFLACLAVFRLKESYGTNR